MTIAELILFLCFLVIFTRALKPLERFVENKLLKAFGVRGPHIIDASIVREKKNKSSKE